MADSHSRHGVSILGAWIISICFWVGQGGATVLLALIVLSPRWFEVERSQADYARNAQVILDLQRENARLYQVAHALEFDADYRSRVAVRELRTKMPGELKIPSEYSLDFTAEAPTAAMSSSPPAAVRRSSPLVELMATSGPVRQRCLTATVVLTLLAFLCFNENFLNGGLRGMLRLFSFGLGQRYALSADNSDSNRRERGG